MLLRQLRLFSARLYGFCTGSQNFACFPGWVVKLVKRFATAAVHRAERELQLCSHGHLRNSRRNLSLREGFLSLHNS